MSGEQVLSGGDPNKVPGWAPNPNLDYVDRICPFTSGVWGTILQTMQRNPLNPQNPIIQQLQAQGTSYQRCQRRCMLFVPDPEVKDGEPAKGTCAIMLAAQGSQKVTEALTVLQQNKESA